MRRFITKKVWFLSLLIILSTIILLTGVIRVYAALTPPSSSPAFPPTPVYCETSNGGVEKCDGLDNNCNGQFDEGFNVGVSCGSCGGVYICSGGVAVCSISTPANFSATCYSNYNSCSQRNTGTVLCSGACSVGTPSNPVGYGNACTSAANSCGKTNSGTINCSGVCSATIPANPAGYGTACTSPANSCGQTTSGIINCSGVCSVSKAPLNPANYSLTCSAGVGACQRSGSILCSGACSATAGSSSAEVCDGLDNDCNGVINNGLANTNVGSVCSTGFAGVCSAGTRYQYCNASVSAYTWSNCINSVAASTEVCDGLDNDCNGLVDDGWQTYSTRPLNSNQKGVCVGSKKQCSGVSGWSDLYSSTNIPNYASVDACNGLDNNCDGVVDGGCSCPTGTTRSISCGTGTCVRTVSQTCSGGVYSPACTPGVAGSESCNGLDDNCDGIINNGLPNINTGTPCTTGFAGVCSAGTYYQYCNASVTTYTWSTCVNTVAASTEICDGLDNNCNGQVDENCGCTNGATRSITCGTGSCSRTVSQTCSAGAWGPACTAGSAVSETCNGLDDNCDGSIDNGLVPATRSCSIGVGACLRSGTESLTCNGASGWSSTYSGCTAIAGSAVAETCNGLDDNCNGQVDEGWQSFASRPLNSLQAGVCANSRQLCSSGFWSNWYDSSNIPNYVSVETTAYCDGLDNDCDGSIDEGCSCTNGVTRSITCGVGSCLRTVSQTCSVGVYSPACTAGSAVAETCNGLDDNCDGSIDNGLVPATRSCSVGVGACLRSGTESLTCNGASGWSSTYSGCTAVAGSPTTETCNGLDDNCNGQVDEGWQSFASRPLNSLQAGVCANSRQQCSSGVWSNWYDSSNIPNYVSVETTAYCDGLDNDCDGSIDEGCSCTNGATRTTSCGVGGCSRTVSQTCSAGVYSPACASGNPSSEVCNGLDDNCDGSIDNGLVPATRSCSVGVGACLRSGTESLTCNAASGWSSTYSGCNAVAGSPTTETCNNIDDNCNGQVDDNWTTYPTRPLNSIQVGVCTNSRQQCSLGVWTNWYDTFNIPNYVSVETTAYCDGLDNDCDAQVDEGCSCTTGSSRTITCGTGTCLRTVTQTCNAGVYSPACTPGVSATEICNGLDDNCDGSIDNGLTPQTRTCTVGSGVCQRNGIESQTCTGSGGWSSTYSGCTASVISPTPEICNGLDDNCDGLVDNGLTSFSRACTAGIGSCQRSGVENQTCNGVSGWSTTYIGCTAIAGLPSTEICDAIDNDCDTVNNDGLPNLLMGSYCNTGKQGVCIDGTRYQYCDASVSSYTWSTCNQSVVASAEVCDGLDNNCDGQTDEGWLSMSSRPLNTNQLGVCAGTKKICSGIASWQDSYNSVSIPYYAVVETNANCDGLDNDCDGSVDEGCTCLTGDTTTCGSSIGACLPGTQVCSSGVWGVCIGGTTSIAELCDAFDNNCDGLTNNGLANINVSSCSTGLQGVCANGTKYQYCNENITAWNWSSCNQTVDASTEICDGLDNDCNGLIDENWTNYSTRPLNNNQLGVCAGSKKQCLGNNSWQDWYNSTNLTNYQITENLCDGLDNDCDGNIDEGCLCISGITRNTTCGLGTCLRTVLQTCNGTAWGPECVNGTPSIEICNALDDNCNGQVDENVCTNSGTGSGGSSGSGGIGGSTSNNTANTSVSGGNTNGGTTNPNIETPGNVNPDNQYAQTEEPPLENVKSFSKANRIIIVLAIIIVIGGVLTFVLIEKYRDKEEETVPTNAISSAVNLQQLPQGRINNVATNTYAANPSAMNPSAGFNNKMVDPDAPAINYVFVMRQKGFKDDVIKNNLRSKGWSEGLLNKLFK